MKSSQQILVVDDDIGILDAFSAMLADDYHVVLVNNGQEALRHLETQNPMLMFMDIKMPGLNGIDVLRALKKQGRAIKIVVVTALPQDRCRELAEQYGVYRYLSKPLDVDEIEDIARQLIH
jgi:two-component system response regulator (stage 0 sporulation protein F)